MKYNHFSMSEISIEITYPHVPELIWDALTHSEAINRWSIEGTENDFKPIIDYKFQVRIPPYKRWNGVINGQVLQIKKPYLLVYSWKTEGITTSTIVTWTLEPTEIGTKVRLHHSEFEGLEGFIISKLIVRLSWKKMIEKNIPTILSYIQKNGLHFGINNK